MDMDLQRQKHIRFQYNHFLLESIGRFQQGVYFPPSKCWFSVYATACETPPYVAENLAYVEYRSTTLVIKTVLIGFLERGMMTETHGRNCCTALQVWARFMPVAHSGVRERSYTDMLRLLAKPTSRVGRILKIADDSICSTLDVV
ncbi:hypothetical protein EVAR_39618_1 [Eumeta japonica]|uniref:Uncharacterized protein n=1 Tax=Eumeta variegata TaxID=151549 RepID=A0A4C1WFW6_EUMVA|nr:hypothetical protein EVAR_39618_1 [Eumeta japonica]